MQKIFYIVLFLGLIFLASCGTPNDPESIIGGDGGYKIVSKFITSGYAQDVVVNDTLAFVTQGEGGLMIVNIASKTTPHELRTIFEQLKGYSNKVAIKDLVVFVSAGAFGVSTVDINLINTPNPVTATLIPIKPAEGFGVMGDFVFTAIGENGFKVAWIDTVVGNQLDPRGETSTPGFAQAVCASPDRNYLLVACGEMGFALFNISEFSNGQGTYPLLSWVDTPGYAEDVVAHPTLPYAFLACGTGGFFIVDYSDSANVKVVGSYSTGGYAKEVIYKNNKAYVTTGARGLQIFDVSNFSSPVLIGTVETELAMGLAVDDKYVYVADEAEGLIIISIP
jgi:hypothetical protein